MVLLPQLGHSVVLAPDEEASMAIFVFAGEDQSICINSDLDLSTLQASISGDVSDGVWFSYGDGFFQSTGTTSAIFSTATTYHPGFNEQAGGRFVLYLVSDDPDNNGPRVEVTDSVVVTFQTAPPLVCNTNLSVSLDVDCRQELTVPMLVASPEGDFSKYTIRATDATGQVIPNNTVTGDHLGQTITFRVSHECSPTNSCGGMLTVSDYVAPVITCRDTIVDCDASTHAWALGLPIPANTVIDTISVDSFNVQGWDACSAVLLTYTDSETTLNCGQPFTRITNRLWRVADESNNTNFCNQTIYSRRLPLDSVTFPPHYNDLHNAALSCDADYPRLDNGHPDPAYTGSPALDGCDNIEVTMTDTRYDGCGGSYSIWRNWSVIDWCTARDIDSNQIIKIIDTIPPQIICADTITVGTVGYECWSRPFAVMAIDSVVDCSAWTAITRLRPVLGGPEILSTDYTYDEVPVGEYELRYEITDACGNATTCSTLVRVVDSSAPFAICEGFTKVSLGQNGFARLHAAALDDNSIDNCGIANMQVARMQSGCGVSAGNFGDFVDFCCADVGTPQMVAFTVTDYAGNVNTCMSEVTIEDKLDPVMTCLPDITITCDYPLDTTRLDDFGSIRLQASNRQDIIVDGRYYGRDGLATDNCTVDVSTTYTVDIDCGAGQVVRSFVATDAYGMAATCTQTITVERERDFTIDDINWPADRETTGCGLSDHLPDTTGEPTYNAVPCARVDATYDDQVFEIADSACVQIVRTWTVIDWCIYDAATDYGRWSQVQVIRVDNIVAPTITACTDTLVCTYAQDCGPALYETIIQATDDCTSPIEMQYLWTIDSDGDGVSEFSGSESIISATLPVGDHVVHVQVNDACGNGATCSYIITIQDCKRPTPYCRSSLSTVVMPDGGTIDIFASHFDLGGSDNCGGPLHVSFSSNISDTIRTLTCDDLMGSASTTIMQEIWYTDASGNHDFCEVEILLQDNDNSCGNGPGLGTITGRIATQAGQVLDSVRVAFESSTGEHNGVTWALDGAYSITVPAGESYRITPSVIGAAAHEGISTLDLVLTQRHIIAASPFVDPLRHIAADINGSKTIRGSDVIMMRELALRKVSTIPVEPVTFVPASFDFEDAQSPHEAPAYFITDVVSGDLTGQDFYMLKRGDVNGDYFADGRRVAPRSAASIGVRYTQEVGGQTIATLYAQSDATYDGIQLHLRHTGAAIKDLRSATLPLGDYDVRRMLGDTYVALALPQAVEVMAGDALFSVVLDQDAIIALGDDLTPEYYEQGQPRSVHLVDMPSASPGWEVAVASNPFVDQPRLTVTTSDATLLHCTLADITGRVLLDTDITIDGPTDLPLESGLFAMAGTYVVRLTDDAGRVELVKVVRL